MDFTDEFDSRWAQIIRDNLKRLRVQRRMTQRQFAEATGIPLGTLGPIESGHDDPTLRIVTRAAEGLGVHVAEIFGAPPALPPPAYAHLRQGGYVSDQNARFVVADVPFPEFGLFAGDVLTIEPADELREGELVVLVEDDGEPRLHLVESVVPVVVLVRSRGPRVLFERDHHRIVGVVTTLMRHDPGALLVPPK